MCNSAGRQSISEKKTLSSRNGLMSAPSRDENPYVESSDSKLSKNDRRKKLLNECEYLLRNRPPKGNQKSSSRKCDKSSTSCKNANDLDFSKYWISGEQFFQTPPKNFNESDECSNEQDSATFVQLFGNDDDDNIFQSHRRVSSNDSKLDDTFVVPTKENNDDNKLDMLKDVKTSSHIDEDFLHRFKLPFYRPELENDNKITNSNFAIDTSNFNETNRTSPNKNVRKSNVTEDIRSCCFESSKEGYCEDAVMNIRKSNSQEQYSTPLELKFIKEKEDFQKIRTSKDDGKQTSLSGGKKIIGRKDKVKKWLNNMLLLIDDISIIEYNKENIKKHNHHRKTSWDNLKRKSSYNSVGPRFETVELFKEKKARKVSPSIYPTCRHLDQMKKHNGIRLNRQVNVQPVWKPAGAVKPLASNPTFLNNEPINFRSQTLFNKDNQIVKRSIANPSESTVLRRKHFLKDNRRNENLIEEGVNDLCELFAKTQITSKGREGNRNSSNMSLMNVRGKSRELNLTKNKSQSKLHPRIFNLTPRNTSQILFKNKQDGKLPMANNSSTNIPTKVFIKNYEKNDEIKDQILNGLENNDNRKSSMHLLKIHDKFPANQSSTYQNQETEQSTKKEMKEESSKEKLHLSDEETIKIDDSNYSSDEKTIKIDDSNYSPKSVLKSYENLDHHTPIENQPSLTSSTNISYKTDLSSVSNLMTAATASKCCQASSLSSSESKISMIFNQFIKQNQSATIDKDSLDISMDYNREKDESDELSELNDRFKQDSDVIDNNEKDKTSPNLVSNVLYSSKINDTLKNPLNKLSIDTTLNISNDLETESMNLTIMEKLRSNDNESIDQMINEKKSKISQTISNLKSVCDAFTNIDDIKPNCFEQFNKTIISSSPNEIDVNVSLKDVATEVLSQDQSILLPIQMIQTRTNERSYKVMKNNATNLNINLINNCDETDTIVNVESKSIGTSDEENLNHNDRWVMETVELYCEQPNDNLSKIEDKDQKENIDSPNDQWVDETVELYCEQPKDENEYKEDKIKLKKCNKLLVKINSGDEQPNDENEYKEDKIKLKKYNELLTKINNNDDNIEKSTLSESLMNQLNGIKEQLQSVDMQLNKLQATTIQANDVLYRIDKTTIPLDYNSKKMTVSSNDLSESLNEKKVKNDDRFSNEDLRKSSLIEASLSSCHSFERSSKISEEHFQLLNTDFNKISDNVNTLQTTSHYSTNFYEVLRISEDNSNDNQSKESKEKFSTKSNSLSEDSLEKFVEKEESIERDKRLSCEYFNENCHFYNNLNDFNDKVENILDMKMKSLSVENIFCESKPIDYSLSNDESDETNSFVFVSRRNSDNTEEKEMKIISNESQHSIFFNTNNSTGTVSNASNIRDQGLQVMKYCEKEISSPNLQNEEDEFNDFQDLGITREGLLLLIYFTVCSFVFFCLNFSFNCETFI
ncbi:PREDICTED: probable WRKY transcription factor protein 1 [Polistes dominula]|uniref:Probable WRKY transcription factor protein 1 n=1 Tax=Polistes dominula TaxID=743375 RepID=A0ABM1J4Z2_POLDO|nr:PREDICTED: probable WRKY transcription factor protein 1 [Polistes dominula]